MCYKKEKGTHNSTFISTTYKQNSGILTHKYCTRYRWLRFRHQLKIQSYTHIRSNNNGNTAGEEKNHFVLALRINRTFSVKQLQAWTVEGALSLPQGGDVVLNAVGSNMI